MKVTSQVLLALFGAATHQVLAATAAEPVNNYQAPVIEQGAKINYPQQAIQRQQAAFSEPTAAQHFARLAQMQAVASPGISTSNTQTNSSTLNPVLEIFSLGYGIGVQGLLSGDYNNDGVTELVIASPSSITFAHAVDGKFSLQSQLQFANGIGKIEYFRDHSTDGHFALFSENGKLHKLDLLSRRVIASLDIAAISSYRMHNASSGQAGTLFVRTQLGQMHVIDPVTLKIISSQSDMQADIKAIGAFTDKTKLQILLKNGQIYNVVANKFSLEKTITADLSAFTNVVDVNADGLDELLVTQHWYDMKLLSPNTEEVLWSKRADLNIDAVILADVNKDGKLDGVYGDGQWGNLYAFDLATGEDFWQIKNPEHGVTNIVVADLDNDGQQDIGWGAGYSSSGGDYFYIHDIASKEKKWQSEDIQFPVRSVALVDVDQDGDLDALSASEQSDSGYGGGVVQAFDIKTKTRLWHAYAAQSNWGKTMHLAAADLDKDGKQELIIGASQIYTGMVRVLNAADGSERFKTLLGDGDTISSVTTADVDQNGFDEIIVSNRAVHTGSAGAYVTVLNGRTGAQIKRSPNLGAFWQGLTDLTALESDGSWLIYGLLNGQLYQYNFTNNSIKQLTTNGNYAELTQAITAGVTELIVADNNGNLLRLSTTGVVLASKSLCNQRITGLSTAGPDRVLLSCNSNIIEYNLTTQNHSFNHNTGFSMAGDPKMVRHNNLDQIIAGGQKISVYQIAAPVALPAPESQRLNTHVLKTLTGTLSIAADIDYFVLGSSTKLGQLRFIDRKAGTFSYTPNGTLGSETFQVYAVKGHAVSPATDISIELSNSAPVAEHLNISTHWNSALQFSLPAKDDDAESLTFALSSTPKHGEVKLLDANKGTVQYQPSGNSIETVSFSFYSKDSLVSSAQKNVVITLSNTTPVASAISYTTSYQTPVHGALKGQDADNDVISYEISSQPTVGSLTLDSKTGLFVYTPAGDSDQQISFSYVVKDKFAASTAQTVSIHVKGNQKGSSGGAVGLLPLCLLLLSGLYRRQRRH